MIAEYRKAILAAVIAGLSAAVPLMDDGLTPKEIATIALAVIVAGAGVWAVPNAAKANATNWDEPPRPQA